MAPIFICVTGPGNTGKSTIIREFTAKHLKYRREPGDVLGIFPVPKAQKSYVPYLAHSLRVKTRNAKNR
jgi:guanylate kinase